MPLIAERHFVVESNTQMRVFDIEKLNRIPQKMSRLVTITSVNPVYWFVQVELEDAVVTKFDEKPDMKDLDK